MKTQFNKKYKGTKSKIKPGKSMTVPDQGLTIQQLLERHSRGVSLGAPDLKGEYFDTEIPRHDDLTDALEHKKQLDKKAKELDKQIKKEQAEQKAKKAQSIKEKSEVEDSQAEKVAKATDKDAKAS